MKNTGLARGYSIRKEAIMSLVCSRKVRVARAEVASGRRIGDVGRTTPVHAVLWAPIKRLDFILI